MDRTGRNIKLSILNENGAPYYGLEIKDATFESVVMSLGDKISGSVVSKLPLDLEEIMHTHITYGGVDYILVNPPTKVKEGMASDNSGVGGMIKYSFEYYHPMCMLSNIPFTDVAVTDDEERYKSQDRNFFWIGYIKDFVDKLNKNLSGTEWAVTQSENIPLEASTKLSEVLTFDNQTIADALKTAYDTWGVPYVIDTINNGTLYEDGKRFVIQFGLPSEEIYEIGANGNLSSTPFVFKFGQGVGLKNESANPKNNKIITRIAGYGSETNVPYGYPQIVWEGDEEAQFTIGDSVGVKYNVDIGGKHYDKAISFPIYDGIVGGRKVRLIKHPFTRTHLMPSIYGETIDKKVNPFNEEYDCDAKIIDYYDAISDSERQYPHEINPLAPSFESHQFEDIKPELGEAYIKSATPLNNDLTEATSWDDEMDENGEYTQSYFKIKIPRLDFDLYASAAITQEMKVNMRGGACIGCTFTVQVDWDLYKKNFYRADGTFDPEPHVQSGDGHVRDLSLFPNSKVAKIELILQKDMNTFGTLMPNIYQYPKPNDQFVILSISQPLEYIQDAEERLDEASKDYMLENNEYKFEYPLKFDEFFLSNNLGILAQIRNNVIVRFEVEGKEHSLYIKQITVKYSESALPKYDITLSDDIEISLNKIGETVDEVSKLTVFLNNLRKDFNDADLTRLLTRVNADASVVSYLRQALNQDTEVQGGLLLTTLLALRDEDNVVWSGVNGAYDKSKTSGGIAAWYGGAMIDKEEAPSAEEYAKSLLRFDGTGYLANGNVSWDKDGNVTLRDINARNGYFSGNGEFSGVVVHDSIEINKDNFSEYVTEPSEQEWHADGKIDIGKAGSNIRFVGEFEGFQGITLEIPSVNGADGQKYELGQRLYIDISRYAKQETKPFALVCDNACFRYKRDKFSKIYLKHFTETTDAPNLDSSVVLVLSDETSTETTTDGNITHLENFVWEVVLLDYLS